MSISAQPLPCIQTHNYIKKIDDSLTVHIQVLKFSKVSWFIWCQGSRQGQCSASLDALSIAMPTRYVSYSSAKQT